MIPKYQILIPCCICDQIPERNIRCSPITIANFFNDVETFRVYEVYCKCVVVYSFQSAGSALAKWNFKQLLLYGRMAELTNIERYEFVRDLGNSELNISEWEEGFIENVLNLGLVHFTDKQQAVIDRMIAKYDDKIL